MKIFKILILSACFLLGYLPAHAGTHFISLGRDCQVAGRMIAFNLRNAAYPLDWMVSPHFNGVTQVIKDDFKYFLDPAFLEYKIENIENTYYHFTFNHFFPLVGQPVTKDVHIAGTVVPNYLDYLPAVQETQGRRITRLLNLLSSREKVVFIRTHASQQEVLTFVNMIKTKYPRLDFLLVVVNEKNGLSYSWSIPNVLNFDASQRCGLADWWNDNEWQLIFQKIAIHLTCHQN
ncbi:MAG: hypothetical protein H0V82_06165 [Candidatus Protochlamydia sp.]|nr:hypothetical protein [Candidatus Protochlamydia sp.]